MDIMDFGRNSFVTHTTGLIERVQEAEKEIQMRQYRGLTKDGKLVYGWYVFDVEWAKHYIYNSTDFTRGAFYVLGRHEVIPETVGQQVGLKDKNGKGTNEACKDDIVICSYNSNPNHRFKGVIKYNAPEFYLACFWEDTDGEQCSFPVGDNNRSLVLGWSIDEILGNIHQHPNLMEQGSFEESELIEGKEDA